MQSHESWMMMAVICATLIQICLAMESLSKADTNPASKPLVLCLNGAPALFLASFCLTLGKKQRKRSLNIVLAATLILVFLLSIQPLNAYRIPEKEKEERNMLVSESLDNRPPIKHPSPNLHGCGYVPCPTPSKKPVEQKDFAAHPTAPHVPSHVKVPFGSATNGTEAMEN